jgi:hypothetical protein
LDNGCELTGLNIPYKEKASMTKKLTAMLLMTAFLAGAVFAQTVGGAKGVKAVTIRIDGFMKSKSGAI